MVRCCSTYCMSSSILWSCPCPGWLFTQRGSLPCGWRALRSSRRPADRRAALTACLAPCTSPPARAETRVRPARWQTPPIDGMASRQRRHCPGLLMQSAHSGRHALLVVLWGGGGGVPILSRVCAISPPHRLRLQPEGLPGSFSGT